MTPTVFRRLGKWIACSAGLLLMGLALPVGGANGDGIGYAGLCRDIWSA